MSLKISTPPVDAAPSRPSSPVSSSGNKFSSLDAAKSAVRRTLNSIRNEDRGASSDPKCLKNTLQVPQQTIRLEEDAMPLEELDEPSYVPDFGPQRVRRPMPLPGTSFGINSRKIEILED